VVKGERGHRRVKGIVRKQFREGRGKYKELPEKKNY